MSSSLAPSKTGVTASKPRILADQPEMRFEDLADVHTTRHTQRIEHDIQRRSVFEERHVLFRHDLGDHTLVTVATGHLVTDRQRSLDRDIDLGHLENAAGQARRHA